MTLVLRADKGSALTHNEVDENFRHTQRVINTDTTPNAAAALAVDLSETSIATYQLTVDITSVTITGGEAGHSQMAMLRFRNNSGAPRTIDVNAAGGNVSVKDLPAGVVTVPDGEIYDLMLIKAPAVSDWEGLDYTRRLHESTFNHSNYDSHLGIVSGDPHGARAAHEAGFNHIAYDAHLAIVSGDPHGAQAAHEAAFDHVAYDAHLAIISGDPHGARAAHEAAFNHGSYDAHLASGSIHFADAPSDGTQYGRENGGWTPVTAGTGDVTGPAGGVVADEIASYSNTTGKGLKGSSGLLAADVASHLAIVSGDPHGARAAHEAAFNHSNYNSHLGDPVPHREINDAGAAATDLWSASKITTELATKADLSGGNVFAGTQEFSDEAVFTAGLRVTAGNLSIWDPTNTTELARVRVNGTRLHFELVDVSVTTMDLSAVTGEADFQTDGTVIQKATI